MTTEATLNSIKPLFAHFVAQSINSDLSTKMTFLFVVLMLFTLILSRVYRASLSVRKQKSHRRCYSLILWVSNLIGTGLLALFLCTSSTGLPHPLSNAVMTTAIICFATALINLSIILKVNSEDLPFVRSLTQLNFTLLICFMIAFSLAQADALSSIFIKQSDELAQSKHYFLHLVLVPISFPIVWPLLTLLSRSWIMRKLKPYLRYFGYGLKPRTCENLIINKPTTRRIQRPDLSPTRVKRTLKGMQDSPSDRVTYSARLLSSLIRYPMSITKRFTMTEVAAHEMIHEYYHYLAKYQNDGGIPDKLDKAKELEEMLRIIIQLRELYGQIFSDIYRLPNLRFGPQRTRFQIAAIRCLELAYLEQLLGACRYKDISSQTWKTIHSVYAIMDSCETVERNSLILQFKWENQKPKHFTSDIKTLYLQILIAAYWDFHCLPTYTTPLLSRYVKNHLDLVEIIPFNKKEHLTQYHLIFSQFFEHGALTKESAKEVIGKSKAKYPTYILNLSSLVLLMDSDHAELMQDSDRKKPFSDKHNFFKRFSDAEKRIILRHFYEALHMHDETKSALTRGLKALKRVDLLIYIGFKDCFEMALDLIKEDDINDNRELRNRLAMRSAAFGKDETAEVQSNWFCTYDTISTLGLRSQETNYTVPMRVGRLIIYDDKKYGEPNPKLGLISRIERNGTDKFDVLIRKFVGKIEVVAYLYTEPGMDKSSNTKPIKQAALKVSDKRNRHVIIMPADRPCRKGQPITLLQKDGKRNMEFEDIAIQNEELLICKLRPRQVKKDQQQASNKK